MDKFYYLLVILIRSSDRERSMKLNHGLTQYCIEIKRLQIKLFSILTCI